MYIWIVFVFEQNVYGLSILWVYEVRELYSFKSECKV